MATHKEFIVYKKSTPLGSAVAWYRDLDHCDYFGKQAASNLRSVGWLEKGKPFHKGKELDAEVYRKLEDLFRNPWQPFSFLGFHLCDFCADQCVAGAANLFVPGNGFLYVCPELILHYISVHEYCPPQEFCQAVLECAPTDSSDYLEMFHKCGGRSLWKR